MKPILKKISLGTWLSLAFLMLLTLSGCNGNLLDQKSTTQLPESEFWSSVSDAESGLNGLYSDVRYVFNRDYYLDSHGEFVKSRGNSFLAKNYQGGAYAGLWDRQPVSYGGGYANMYQFCYGSVNRANYVIDNVQKMLAETAGESDKKQLERIIAESKMLRALVYFRLISMWGDVQYFNFRVYKNEEVQRLPRTPIAAVKDSIIADLTEAFGALPDKSATVGRASKYAALALRGKVYLYWACWNHYGWDELDTFTPSEDEATDAYRKAADDFLHVIDDYGLTLFRNGDPGECDTLGKAEKLPSYFELFLPTANGDDEFILAFNHGGAGTNQSDELMRDLAGRTVEYSQCWVYPTFNIADRYQSTLDGDFCPPLEPANPANDPAARTKPNSAVNPQSYANRDYRMKASIMWDYEMCMGLYAKRETGWSPFIYKNWGQPIEIGGQTYTTYNTDGTNSGYVFRKFVRSYAGQERSEGDFSWPVIRLADVYLMYAEADNALNGPQPKAIELVNRVRHRGNLPALADEKTATKEVFFEAIEQERIVELLGEGQRMFDIRRWRAIERIYGQPFGDGKKVFDTHGSVVNQYYVNFNEYAYQRCYIFQIPESERDKNPNLSQNKPFR
ncbi:MAG: RagB/SusD family nutrient uptake outer membrane protein [Prevotellaceae bacterium]|jgi:hypothetical protein|nr:RagB/SusD family nutrient uptake outer membrane protein [Prevotellaceae bacterium]